jgi:hypothetical protein
VLWTVEEHRLHEALDFVSGKAILQQPIDEAFQLTARPLHSARLRSIAMLRDEGASALP